MVRLFAALSLLAAMPLSDREQVLRELHGLDVRVANLTDRLAMGGRSLCRRTVPRWPLVLEDAALYLGAERDVAVRVYGLGEVPVITSPLAWAGFAVTEIEGKSVGPPDRGDPHSRIDKIDEAVEAGATLTVLKNGQSQHVKPLSRMGCPSRPQVIPSRKRNAAADGKIIQITTAVILETTDDDELAFVLAHEMAHNVLEHKALLDVQGRKAANIRMTEIEADRFGLQLMKAAGFDPRAAARFWARFGRGLGEGIFSDGTHMRGRERVTFLTEEARKLTQ